jgi:hypothetical protein
VPHAETNEIRYDRKLNVIRAEVERELQRDAQLGNTCQNLVCRGPLKFVDANRPDRHPRELRRVLPALPRRPLRQVNR